MYAGNHETKNCEMNKNEKENTKACFVCTFANTHLNNKRDINHYVSDRVKCESLKRNVAELVSTINYPIEGAIPRYLCMRKKIK